MDKENKLLIIGAGGHGRVVADIAALCGYKEIFFLDDNFNDQNVNSNIIGKSAEFEKYLCSHSFVVAVGNNNVRKKIQKMILQRGGHVVSLIHPSAVIGSHVNIGVGTVVMANAVINTGTDIGDGVIINTCSSVDHDCKIGDFSHISVGAHVAGTVNIGDVTMIGAGATVINNVNICADCMIGAGAVVIGDINISGTYVGVPAKNKA